MKVQHFLLTGLAVAVLSACGSDKNSKTIPAEKIEPAKTVTKAGKIVDPTHRKGAVAFVDMNQNYMLDNDEPSSAVDETTGEFSMQVPENASAKEALVKVDLGNDKYGLLASLLNENYTFAGTLAHHHLWMENGSKDSVEDVEKAFAKAKSDLGLNYQPEDDYAAKALTPGAIAESIRQAKADKVKNRAGFAVYAEIMANGLLDSPDEDIEYKHQGSLHRVMSEAGLQAVSQVAKAHEQYADTFDMKAASYQDIIESILNLGPNDSQGLIPLTKAMDTAVPGNAAQYFATDGFNTLGVSDPEGSSHAPSHSKTHYDVASEETHLSNYHFAYDYESNNGYFRSTGKPQLENHFVFNTTDREFKKSYHKWEVADIDMDTSEITLVNPWNRFVSRSPVSKVYDVSGVSIDAFLSQHPDLKKSWGYLVADDAVFAEGSEINRLTITNNNQVFLLPEANECKPTDGNVKYAIVSDEKGEKKLCNYIYQHVNGEKSQALTFDEFFVSEFAPEDDLTDSNVNGVIVAMDGSSYIVAQLKDATGNDDRGNVKFFMETHKPNEAGGFDKVISVFPTSTPSTWEAQSFGTGSNKVDLCRITLPKEVAGFGREVQMHKHAFVVELGEGTDRALRHGKVLEAGMVLPKKPKGLNAVAIDSILDNISIAKYKHHEHEEYQVDKKCHDGNSLMKDKFNKIAYSETMKTRDEYHTSAKNCTTYGEDVSTVADFSGRKFELSEHDDDPYSLFKFGPETDSSGVVQIFQDVGSEALYEYEGTYTFHPENSSVKISFVKPEDGKTHHIYLTRVKSEVDENGNVVKCHLKILHVIDDAIKGIVGHHIFHVKPLPIED